MFARPDPDAPERHHASGPLHPVRDGRRPGLPRSTAARPVITLTMRTARRGRSVIPWLAGRVPRAFAWQAALLLLPGALVAQTGTPLRGRVVDAAGNPLAGATIELLDSYRSVPTAADG